MPKVSVIIPNYNHAPFLEKRIDSVLNQTYQNFELIILDDFSKDNSKHIIEKYRNHPKVSNIIYNESNSGSPFKQWKKGVDLAKGEFIWIAESDDYADIFFLEELIEKALKNPSSGIIYCESYSVNRDDEIIGVWNNNRDLLWENDFEKGGMEMISKYLIYANVIPNASAVLLNKSKINFSFEIASKFKINGDWLIWIKLLENSDISFLSKKLNYFRQHDIKASNTAIRTGKNWLEYIKIQNYLKSRIIISKSSKNEILHPIIIAWLNSLKNKDVSIKTKINIFYYLLKYNCFLSTRILGAILYHRIT
jgi:glycosyltransferase involved in cell wall biosynthesis